MGEITLLKRFNRVCNVMLNAVLVYKNNFLILVRLGQRILPSRRQPLKNCIKGNKHDSYNVIYFTNNYNGNINNPKLLNSKWKLSMNK